MLKGLESINWQQLTHAYGMADDVPSLLKALTSNNAEIWEGGLEKLYSNLWHQGTIYQATVVAIPFLLELLEYEEVHCRDKILEYLAIIANAYSDNTEMQWAKIAHHIIAQNFQTYLNLFENAEINVKICIPYLLFTLEEYTTETVFFVQSHILQETDVLVKASLLIYLSNHPTYAYDDNQLFKKILVIKNEHFLLNVLAAIALVKRLKENASIETIQVLVKAVAYFQTLEDVYRKLPWPKIYNTSLLGDISTSLLLLDFKASNLIIPALLQASTYIDKSYQSRGSVYITDMAIIPVIHALLYFAFGGEKIRENLVPFLLTNTQRHVLINIMNNDIIKVFFDDVVEILDAFGLPPLWKLRILLQ